MKSLNTFKTFYFFIKKNLDVYIVLTGQWNNNFKHYPKLLILILI